MTPKKIRFYPSPWNLGVMSIGLLAYALATEQESNPHLKHVDLFRHMAILFFFAILLCACYLNFLRGGAVDERGLWWRNRHGQQFALWEEVTDFCHVHDSGFQVDTINATVTLRSDLVHIEAVRKFILEKTGVRLGLTDWELKGLRPRDLPLSYTYSERRIRSQYRWGIALLVLAGVVLSLFAALKPLVILFGGTLTACLPLILIGPSFVVGMLHTGISLLRSARTATRFCGERFTAQEDGFVFARGSESVFVPWDTVIGYDFKPVNAGRFFELFRPLDVYRIRTDCGQEFSFVKGLERDVLWVETIRRYATNGIESRVDNDQKEALGGVELCWSGGSEGRGDRIFHARTRSNRLWMLAWPVITLVPVTSFVLSFHNYTALSVVNMLLYTLCTGAVEWYLVRRFFRERVMIGPDGLSRVTVWKRERVAWSDIADWKAEYNGICLELRSGASLRFQPSQLAYGSRIAPLIEERLPRRDVRTRASADAPAGDIADER